MGIIGGFLLFLTGMIWKVQRDKVLGLIVIAKLDCRGAFLPQWIGVQ
jgi:hypothetical protein